MLVHVLWSAAALATPACGRLGFDDRAGDPGGKLPDGASLDTVTAGPVAMLAASVMTTTLCGGASATEALTVANVGTGDLVISAADATGGFSMSTPLPLTIPGGASRDLTVVPPDAVIGTDRGGDIKAGTLTLTTNAADASRVVNLASTVVGATLEVQAGSDGSSLAFSGSSGVCPAPQLVSIRNVGNASASLSVDGSPGFAFTGFSGGALDPDASTSSAVRPFTFDACAGNGTVKYIVTGNVCSVSPAVVTLSFTITGSSSCSCT